MYASEYRRFLLTVPVRSHTFTRAGLYSISRYIGDLLQLYIMADQFDVKELRTRITDELAYVCYEIDFSLPERGVITLIVDNIPESMPLHRLLAKAVARLLFLLLSTSQVAVAAQCGQ